jgi:hypothetical protein
MRNGILTKTARELLRKCVVLRRPRSRRGNRSEIRSQPGRRFAASLFGTARRNAVDDSAPEIAVGAARKIVMPDHIIDNERQELFCEVRIELSTSRQRT